MADTSLGLHTFTCPLGDDPVYPLTVIHSLAMALARSADDGKLSPSSLGGGAERDGSRPAEWVKITAEWCASGIELVGVAVITLLVVYALLHAVLRLLRRADGSTVFREMRARMVGGILIGLELLVAADIIHTVAVELTYSSVGVLVIVVLIRTFLSFTLELELTGRWPWQHKGAATRHPL